MAKQIKTTPPDFLTPNPEPKLEMRRFHNTDITVWVGEVHIDSIEGWIGNPRTELFAENFKSNFGREPSDEEMYEIVINDDNPKEGLRIRELAGNIYRNGVRVPIVLTYSGKLLDGNRRYYACLFNTKNGADKNIRGEFKKIPALVLPNDVDKKVEDEIITEFNFIQDTFLEWPYFVKASKVYEDFGEKKLEKEELTDKYGLPWNQLWTWIKARDLCEKFLIHHEYSFLARQFAYRHFIMFDEMARRYITRFDETDFSDAIFDILLDGYDDGVHRFRSSESVIRLRDIRDNSEAWDTLTARRGKDAVGDALRVLEVVAYEKSADTNKRLGRIVNNLSKLIDSGSMRSADENLLEEFHTHAEQMPGAPSDPATRVQKMVEWLDAFTAKEMAELGLEIMENLRIALERVLTMTEAAKGQKK